MLLISTIAQIDDYRGLEIALLAASIVVATIGFGISGWLDRRNNVHLKRLEYRMDAMHAVLKMYFFIEKDANPFLDPAFLPLVEDARSKVLLYCADDERARMEAFINAVQSRDLSAANIALKCLVDNAVSAIQRDLAVEPLTPR